MTADREPQTGETALMRARRVVDVLVSEGLLAPDIFDYAVQDKDIEQRLIHAATAQEPDTRPASVAGLGEAWAEAEAALPTPGWNLNLYRLVSGGDRPYGATADRRYPDQPYLTVVSSGDGQPKGEAMYADPVAALRALAQRLREHSDPDAAGEAG